MTRLGAVQVNGASGFLVGPRYYLTAFHAVGNRRTGTQNAAIQVTLSDGSRLDGRVIAADESLDAALIETTESNTHEPFRLLPRRPVEGEHVTILGFLGLDRSKLISVKARVGLARAPQHFGTNSLAPAVQLAVENAVDLAGLSGAPVLFEGFAIGMVRSQIESDDGSGSGIAFCTLVSDITAPDCGLSRFINPFDVGETGVRLLNSLERMGAEVSANQLFRGHLVPLLARFRSALTTHEIAVGFAPDHLESLLDLQRKGAAVVYVAFGDDFQAAATALGGDNAKQFSELASAFVDPLPYVNRFLHDYQNHADFVDADGHRVAMPIFAGLLDEDLAHHYIPDIVTCRPTGDEPPLPLHEYVKGWLRTPNRPRLCILGDYGTGKTAYALFLTAQLAAEFKDQSPERRRLPIYIALGQFRGEPDWPGFFAAQCAEYGIRHRSRDELRRFVESGRVVLILDGFDELFGPNNFQDLRRAFLEITTFDTVHTKTVITCRRGLFANDAQTSAVLMPPHRSGVASLSAFRLDVITDVVILEPLRESHILEVLRRRRPHDWHFEWVLLRMHHLADVASNVLLLLTIVRMLPRLVERDEIPVTQIFHDYTEQWIERESWRSQLTPEAKRRLTEGIALRMWQSGGAEATISRDQVLQLARGMLDILPNDIDWDFFEYDARACSFLSTDPNGNYRIVPRSLYEYFLAVGIARALREQAFATMEGVDALPPPGVMAFLREMLSATDLWSVIDESRREASNVLPLAAAICASVQIGLDPTALRGRNLDTCRLPGADLSGADLSDCSLRGTDLARARLCNVKLDNADLTSAALDGVECVDMRSVHAIAFAPDGHYLAAGGIGGALVVWDVATGRMHATLRSRTLTIGSVSWSADGRFLAIGFEDGTIDLWDPATMELMLSTKAHHGWVYAIAWSQTDLILSGGDDGFVRLLNATDGSIRSEVQHSRGSVLSLATRADGTYVASTGSDQLAYIWNSCLEPVTSLNGHVDYVRCAAWFEHRLITGGDDGLLAFWDTDTWSIVRKVSFNVPILSVDVDTEQAILACGMRDDSLRFVEATSGEVIGTAKEHVGRIWQVRWKKRAQLWATAGNEGVVRIWYAGYDAAGAGLKIRDLKKFETRFACGGLTMNGASGLNALGYQVERHKDRPWEYRNGSLEEWLIVRGATPSRT